MPVTGERSPPDRPPDGRGDGYPAGVSERTPTTGPTTDPSAGDPSTGDPSAGGAPAGCCSSTPPPPVGARERIAARLDGLPRPLLPALIVVLVLVGLVVGGPLGAVPAVLGIALLAGVLALAWPRITLPERLLRLAVLVFLAGLTIVRVIPA